MAVAGSRMSGYEMGRRGEKELDQEGEREEDEHGPWSLRLVVVAYARLSWSVRIEA